MSAAASPDVAPPDRLGGLTVDDIGGLLTDCQQTVNADVHGWRVSVDTFTTQALPIVREVGDRVGEATTLTNIGAVYNGLGDLTQALAGAVALRNRRAR